jgi:hypothetical protein
MVRIGHVVGGLCLLFLRPILPFLAVGAAVSALVRPDADAPEPSYRLEWAESGRSVDTRAFSFR